MTLKRTMYADIDPAPRKDWLVRGLLGEREMSCLFGSPGSGKSVIAGDLACHVGAGRDWFGRRVASGAVLYVAAERAELVGRRFAAFRKFHGVDDIPVAVLAGAIDLRSSPAVADEIAGHARDVRDETGEVVRLVIIDTASRALAGGDENSPKDMGAFVGNLARIQEATGAHVLVVHHIPADGTQRLRGHGALLGACDTTIGVEKGMVDRFATVDKQNDGPEGERLAFTLESIELVAADPDNDATTAPVVAPSDATAYSGPTKATRRLPDRVKTALDVLRDVAGDGVVVAGMPASVRAVSVETWRTALYSRGSLDPDHKNPREDFRRVKAALLARQLAAEKDGQIWAV